MKHVIFYDSPNSTRLPDKNTLRLICHSASVTHSSSEEFVFKLLEQADANTILCSNTPNLSLFHGALKAAPKLKIILLTDLTMAAYSKMLDNREDELVHHIIVNRLPSIWTINEIRITIQKLLQQDYFGLEKYLASETPIQKYTIKGSADRETYNDQVMRFAEQHRLGQYTAKLVFGITEELLMNAIYDAPVAGGRMHYEDIPRTTPVTLQPDEFAELSFAFDGETFGIAVKDPFGALRSDKFFQYLKKVLRRNDSEQLIDTKKGGAGLGLFKILYSCHALICNVATKQTTEVIALLDTKHQVRDFAKMPRSIHFFEQP